MKSQLWVTLSLENYETVIKYINEILFNILSPWSYKYNDQKIYRFELWLTYVEDIYPCKISFT